MPLLYRFLPDYRDPGIQPCVTMDVDLSVDTVLPIRQDRRKQGKHRKDQADVAFVAWAFAASWGEWNTLRRELEGEHPAWAKWIRDTVRTWHQLYLEPDGPGPGEVAAAFGAAGLTADADLIRRVMVDFIIAIDE